MLKFTSWSSTSVIRRASNIACTKNIVQNPTTNRMQRHTKSFRPQTRPFTQGPQRPLTPFEKYASDSGRPVGPEILWRPFCFTVAFGIGSFTAVSIWEYEKIRGKALNVVKGLKNPMTWAKQQIGTSKRQVATWQDEVESWWNKLPMGEKVFIPICALNVLVFALWRVPRFQPAMIKYFCSNPAGQAVCWPMFLSTFSHYSLFHICANMYVLHSFSNIAVMSLGREQFTFLYLMSGLTASLASYAYKVGMGHVGLSIGASGAIMGILAYVCSEYPETKLSIILVPTLTFSAGMAIKCIMGLDVLGLILGWKVFDHAAHLGGAVLGVFWSYYGTKYLWPKREAILQEYHKLRMGSRK